MFDSPHTAWDFVDQRSSSHNNNYAEEFHRNRTVVPKNNAGRDPVLIRYDDEENRIYGPTEYMDGDCLVVRERITYMNRDQGNNYYYAGKNMPTYWKSK
ncbi:hypothetical protein HN011_005032 [Eciton burchellii]|nr:hypothetical protein HN011_005032 [Eciton burchellii]